MPIDDGENRSISYMVFICSRQDLHKKEEQENFTESTNVVPAKHPLNVKLDNFHNSRVLELG